LRAYLGPILVAIALTAVAIARPSVPAWAEQPGSDPGLAQASSDVGSFASPDGTSAGAGYTAEDWDVFYPEPLEWTGRVGAIMLQRGRLAAGPLLTDGNAPAGPPFVALLDARDFDLPFGAGIDLGLVRYGQSADLDLRFFEVDFGAATIGPTAVPPGALLDIPGGVPTPNPAVYSASYDTQLCSFEANLRRDVSPVLAFLAGFRYVYFRDQFGVAALAGSAPQRDVRVNYDGNNNLFGFQIGADGILWDNGDRFRIESAIKAGVYGNAAQNNVTVNNVGQFFSKSRESAGHTAFVGDLNFVGVYQLNDFWSLRGGYQLLWLAGVAVAADQVFDALYVGTPGVNTSGNAFFHGALVGLEAGW
jgi:hypothetical protein